MTVANVKRHRWIIYLFKSLINKLVSVLYENNIVVCSYHQGKYAFPSIKFKYARWVA